MGSDPVEASEFVLGFLCNCFSCLTTVKIIFNIVLFDISGNNPFTQLKNNTTI